MVRVSALALALSLSGLIADVQAAPHGAEPILDLRGEQRREVSSSSCKAKPSSPPVHDGVTRSSSNSPNNSNSGRNYGDNGNAKMHGNNSPNRGKGHQSYTNKEHGGSSHRYDNGRGPTRNQGPGNGRFPASNKGPGSSKGPKGSNGNSHGKDNGKGYNNGNGNGSGHGVGVGHVTTTATTTTSSHSASSSSRSSTNPGKISDNSVLVSSSSVPSSAPAMTLTSTLASSRPEASSLSSVIFQAVTSASSSASVPTQPSSHIVTLAPSFSNSSMAMSSSHPNSTTTTSLLNSTTTLSSSPTLSSFVSLASTSLSSFGDSAAPFVTLSETLTASLEASSSDFSSFSSVDISSILSTISITSTDSSIINALPTEAATTSTAATTEPTDYGSVHSESSSGLETLIATDTVESTSTVYGSDITETSAVKTTVTTSNLATIETSTTKALSAISDSVTETTSAAVSTSVGIETSATETSSTEALSTISDSATETTSAAVSTSVGIETSATETSSTSYLSNSSTTASSVDTSTTDISSAIYALVNNTATSGVGGSAPISTAVETESLTTSSSAITESSMGADASSTPYDTIANPTAALYTTSVAANISIAANTSVAANTAVATTTSAALFTTDNGLTSTSVTLSTETSSSSTLAATTTSVATVTSSITTTSSTVTSTSTSTSSTSSGAAVTVAQDGSAQFTAINQAIAYAQASGIPTVSVLAGTYTEAVTISSTASVTIAGPTAASYADNKVTISQPGRVVTYNAAARVAWRNVKIASTDATAASTAGGAIYLRGGKNAFYGCSLVCAGAGCLTGNYAAALVTDSYLEASDKLLYAYPSVYLFRTRVVPTASNALIVYNQGATINSVLYNSTIVVDSSEIVQKSGTTNTNVFLAAANSAGGSVALFRNTSIASFVAASGVHVDSKTQATGNFYTEFLTSGAGAYKSNSAARAAYVTSAIDASGLGNYELKAFFAGVTPSVASTDVSWIDADIVAAISASNSQQAVQATATTTTTTISSTSTSTSTSTLITTTTAAANVTAAANTTTTATTALVTSTTTTSLVTSTTTTAVPSTFTVAPTPTAGQYGSVQSAVLALPNDGAAYTIYILAGTYTEQLSINRTGLVTLRGETTYANDYTQNKVRIEFSRGYLTSLSRNEETPVLYSRKTDGSGLSLYNIDFVNTYPQTSNTAALAADFYGKKMAAYGCSFVGFQDTLLANQGTQVFSNCYIEGSVDFIWGYSKAFFHQCYIASNTAKGASITAQNRPSSAWAGGFVFDSCYVTYTAAYGTTMGQTYLGRPWSSYAIAVFRNSYLDKHINAAGWSIWSTSAPQTDNVFFGEFNNTGPGAWTSTTERATFATNMTAEQSSAYDLGTFLGDISWVDNTAYGYVPSYPLAANTSTTETETAKTFTWAVPTNGTEPPAGAVLVSVDGSVEGSFSNLTSAIASLPSDSTPQAIFIYPGTYTEQVPSIKRSGPVMLIGYTTATPGSSYSSNTVTLTQARGLSVSPLPTGHSNSETATIATGSTQIALYNIAIINSDNLDGAQKSYVTLAASLYGTHISMYGCSMIGWQDTLLTGQTNGYMYFESSYISGAIDFIWGYSAAYFKGCTIAAKQAKSCITAHNRASSSAIGAYVFDQCLFTAATTEGFSVSSLSQSVYLGRPYNSYARVVVKQSYLGSIIAPAGWKQWSTTSPNLEYVTFAEFNNTGPGNWENNAASREAFGSATLLESDSYPLSGVMDSTSWIDLTRWDSIQTPQETGTTTTVTPETTTYNGTTPPTGAFIVSKTPIENTVTYSTIQEALNALPSSSKTTATVFIYPGSYYEQLTLNKSGTTIFLGYSERPEDYSANTVTITFDHGIDTQADQSNSDGATVYATGNYFKAQNINFANTYGTATNYASLGFAVRSSKYASLYQCSVVGSQDALLINGNLFAANSYIEGTIDMIWGSGRGYFLNSTIAPSRDDISLTADKRASNTTAGGFVFDKCTVTPAKGAKYSQISLGRPWNNLARVAYVESYLDSCVQASGWEQWSKSSPQTDGVLFGEYANSGPGADTSARAAFATQLSDSEVAQFELATFFGDASWVDTTLLTSSPFVAGNATITKVVTVTQTVTVSGVTTTTATINGSQTVSVTVASTVSSKTTVTAEPTTTVTKVQTTTITNVETSSIPGKTTTVVATVISDIGTTVTPAPKTVTSTLKSTATVTSTSVTTLKASTIKSTTTVSSVVTTTAKPVSTTVTVFSTVFATSTAKQSTISTTSTLFKTVGSTDATTTSLKAKTVSATVTTTSVKTTKKTTTLSCIPTLARRSFDEVAEEDLAKRAVTEYRTSTVTVTSTALATSTVFKTGPATTITVKATVTVVSTVTLKAATPTVTVTSTATKASTVKVTGSDVTVSSTTTKTTGKATTLDPVTSTSTVTAMATTTTVVKSTVTSAAVTSIATTSVVSTVTIPASTSTKTVTSVSTIKTTVTPTPVTKVTVKTVTVSLVPSTTVTLQSTVTKTKTVEVKSTVTQWATKTAKNAPTCA
ncbi:pectin lyase-like protein [Ceratocystis lukuohia]|uniref:pectinesterase n=1 Tax=Ceratocystis lukuohia TaxID=2019550 RepID=A0ABR4MJI8_9PEZI